MAKGKVYIMGVGPGDYKLMTIKAAECIAKADVIVYDRLVGQKILRNARPDAEKIYVGKLPDNHAVPQEGINEILVKKAQEGKLVARVKGGDPFMFGRGGEEAEALVKEGLDFEIIPGVTSAIAVPAYAGIPVTHRDFCSSLHIITGHERPDKEESMLDYSTLAKLEGTLVFLMGIKNLQAICSNLIKFGKAASIPAAVVENGTRPEQRLVTGTLADISQKIIQAGIKSPAVTIIGKVVSLYDVLRWFDKKPLSGKRILVTRAREQASLLVDRLEEVGAEAIEYPVIRMEQPEDMLALDTAINNLSIYAWLVFTSVNGVAAFFSRMRELRVDVRKLHGVKICAVGQVTADEINNYGFTVDYVPEHFTTGELLKGLLEKVSTKERLLLARADIASKELSQGLHDNGISFDDVVVYKTVPDKRNSAEAIEMLNNDEIDFVTFTSSSTVRNFFDIIGKENIKSAKKIKYACIGPVTADTLREFGFEPDIIAEVFTIDGLVKSIIDYTGETYSSYGG